jgi:hypothetical protein
MWAFIVGFVIALAASYVLAPKPQTTTKPAGLADLTVPTAETGREIPVLFGCRLIKSSNVVWYGDLKTVPIKSSSGKK